MYQQVSFGLVHFGNQLETGLCFSVENYSGMISGDELQEICEDGLPSEWNLSGN